MSLYHLYTKRKGVITEYIAFLVCVPLELGWHVTSEMSWNN